MTISAANWKAIYVKLIGVGEPIVIKRYTGTGTNRPSTSVTVRGRVLNYQADELTGTIQQGDRHVIILADDLEAGGFPIPIVPGDKCIIRGKECQIMAPDDNTRRYGGELVGYDLQVRG
jgi:hypothetical protein